MLTLTWYVTDRYILWLTNNSFCAEYFTLKDFSQPSLLTHILWKHSPSHHHFSFVQAYDTDSFNRWDAGNRLGSALILKLANMASVEEIEKFPLPKHFVDAIRAVLTTCAVRYVLTSWSCGTSASIADLNGPPSFCQIWCYESSTVNLSKRSSITTIYFPSI